MSYQWTSVRYYNGSTSNNVCAESAATSIARTFGPRCTNSCFGFVREPVAFSCASNPTFNAEDGSNGYPGFFDSVAARNRIPYFVYTSYADPTCTLFAPNIQTSSNREGSLSAIRADGTCVTIPKEGGIQTVNSTSLHIRVTCPGAPAQAPNLNTTDPGLEDIGGVLTVQRCSDPTCDPVGCVGPATLYDLAPRRTCLPDALLGLLDRGFIVGECRVPGEGRDVVYPAPGSSFSSTPAPAPTLAPLAWRPSVMVPAGRSRFDADAAASGNAGTTIVPTLTATSATASVATATAKTTTKKSGGEKGIKDGMWGRVGVLLGVTAILAMMV